MGPRNPFLSGSGRGQGQPIEPSPLRILGDGNRITKETYVPPRRGWKDNSRANPPRSPPGLPSLDNRNNLSNASPPRRIPDFSNFAFPSYSSRASGDGKSIAQSSLISPGGSRKSLDDDWTSEVFSEYEEEIDQSLDQHNSPEIDMDHTYDRIDDVLKASHFEMHHRLGKEPMSSVTDTISKHVSLVTPPNSPGLALPSLRRPSTEEALRQLQEKSSVDLVQSDRQLHQELHEIASIREWWTANKSEWQRQKMKLDQIQKAIDTLRLRHDEVTLPQIEEQEKAKKPLIDWFKANGLQMNQVYAQYLALEARIQQISSSWRSSRQGFPRLDTEPQGEQNLSFIYDKDRKNIESFTWYQNGELSRWYGPANSDIEAELQRMNETSHENTAETMKLAKLADKLGKKISQDALECIKRDQLAEEYAFSLTSAGGNDGYIADVDMVLIKRHNERINEGSQLYNDLAKSKILSKRQETMAFMKGLLEVEALRTATVNYILSWISHRDRDRGSAQSRELDNVDLLNDLYSICWLHNRRRENSHKLVSYFQDDTRILGENRINMLEAAKELYANQQSARQKLNLITSSNGFTPDSIRSILKIYEDEHLEYQYRMQELGFISMRRDFLELPKEDIPHLPKAAELIRPKLSLLGTGMSTAEATAILAKEYTGERQPQRREIKIRWPGAPCYHDVLTRFFTSPDVFPIFRGRDASWTLKEFVDAVNSHVAEPFSAEVLGAFVHYSHRFRQLFRITFLTNRIKSLRSKVTGWETCEEHSVDGPLRKGGEDFYRKPKGLEDVEILITENAKTFRDERREGISGYLLDRINGWEPKKRMRLFFSDRAIKEETFRSFLVYWSLSGTFFVYDDRYGVNDQNYLGQKILRVDHGWPVEWGTHYEFPSLPVLPLMKHHFQDIEKDIYDCYTSNRQTYNLIQGMQTEEGAELESVLYDQIYNGGVPAAYLSQKVSKHAFHLFLRNCREKNRLFIIRRNGAVRSLPEYWPLNTNTRSSHRR